MTVMFITGASARIRQEEVKRLASFRNISFRAKPGNSPKRERTSSITLVSCKRGTFRFNERLNGEKFD